MKKRPSLRLLTKANDMPPGRAKENALVESAEIIEQDLGMIAAAIHRKDFEEAMVLASTAFGKAHSHAVNLKHHFQDM
jgi:hypothetical protein